MNERIIRAEDGNCDCVDVNGNEARKQTLQARLNEGGIHFQLCLSVSFFIIGTL